MAYNQALNQFEYKQNRPMIDLSKLIDDVQRREIEAAASNRATNAADQTYDYNTQAHPAMIAQEQNQATHGDLVNEGIQQDQRDEKDFRATLPPMVAAQAGQSMSPQDILMEAMRTGQATPAQYAAASAPTGPTPAEIAKEAWERDYKERQLKASMANTAKDNDLASAKYELSKQKTDAELARKAVDVGEVAAQADESVALIDQMIGTKDESGKQIKPRHPGFGGFVGAKGPSSLWGLLDKPISGTDAAGFSVLYDQVMGGAFLEAVQKMRGTGALSDTEGKAAKGAIARMQAAQSEKEFIKAAEEYRSAIKNRKSRVIAKQAAGAPGMSPAAPAGVVKWGRGPDGKPVKLQ